jgi:hypothetical protein
VSRVLSMPSHRSRLPVSTKDGFAIRYELVGLGTLGVIAAAHVVNAAGQEKSSRDISEDIKKRQFGDDRPFRWTENLFDIFVGDYAHNPLRRNWAGSDLSGGTQIHPGGIGDVLVPCVDRLDCISKKHDIEFWLSANFEPGAEVRVKNDKGEELFIVKRQSAVNRQAVIESVKALLRPDLR